MDTKNTQQNTFNTTWSHGWKLALVASVCVILVTLAYLYAQPIIDKQQAEYRLKTLKAVFPSQLYNNQLLQDTIEVPGLTLGEQQLVHVARWNDNISGYVFQVQTQKGYSGSIELVIGIDLSGKVLGVRVVNHSETPGLGDKIDIKKSFWITSFTDKSLRSPPKEQWKVKKDGGVFDSFTGATITPRAVIEVVKDALLHYERHQLTWKAAANNASIDTNGLMSVPSSKTIISNEE